MWHSQTKRESPARAPARRAPPARPVAKATGVPPSACACGGGCPCCRKKAPAHPELRVSRPGDASEREADRLAQDALRAQPVREQSRASAVTPPHNVPATALRDVPGMEEETSARGEPLDRRTRERLEPRFGASLGHVRVHAGGAAARSARALGAAAYAVGSDIVFGEGRYRPQSEAGRALLAHEIAHTLRPQPGVVHRQCLSATDCRTPLPGCGHAGAGGAEDYGERLADEEAAARERRGRMPPGEGRGERYGSGHMGRAAQLEEFLSAADPAARALIHGIFIDQDTHSGGYLSPDCCTDDPAAASRGGCITRSSGLPCMFVPGHYNAEAQQFNHTMDAVIGAGREARSRENWRVTMLGILVHEAQHARFDTRRLGRTTRTSLCRPSRVEAELTELNAQMQEFITVYRNTQSWAASDRDTYMNSWLRTAVTNCDESFAGALRAARCKCPCSSTTGYADLNRLIEGTFRMVTTDGRWTPAEQTYFNSRLRDPQWDAWDLHWPL